MIGVVIVTHAKYGEELLEAAQGILGRQEHCAALSVNVAKDMENSVQEIHSAVKEVDSGEGAIILTDMFGGTPSNLSLSLIGTGQLEVITGVNLPMLLKILETRGQNDSKSGSASLESIAHEAKSAGRQGILVAGEILKRKVAHEQK